MRIQNTLIIFTKAPQICRVKTRLSHDLSYRECLQAFKLMSKTTVNSLINSQRFKTVIYTTNLKLQKNLHRNIRLEQQHGNNLGERMHKAITKELKKSQRVILIGTDCVEFTKDNIEQAFSYLNAANDIVITPTHDGGYCLIGMTRNCKSIFTNITWSADNVFNETETISNKFSKNLQVLEMMHDIDHIQDLYELDQLGRLPNWAKRFIS